MEKALRLIVEGRVQGVGYRQYTSRIARKLGVRGFVKNLDDGRVEILAISEPEIMNEFISSARKGPAFSWVYNIQYQEQIIDKEYNDFKIVY